MSIKEEVQGAIRFRVDFKKELKREGLKFHLVTRYFVIGVLPVQIGHDDGKQEKALLSIPVEVQKDPFLRLVQGKKYKNLWKIRKEAKKQFKYANVPDFVPIADEIIEKGMNAVQIAITNKEWNGKPIKSVIIVKL